VCEDAAVQTGDLQLPSSGIMTAVEQPMQDATDTDMLMQPVNDPSPMEDGA